MFGYYKSSSVTVEISDVFISTQNQLFKCTTSYMDQYWTESEITLFGLINNVFKRPGVAAAVLKQAAIFAG